MSTHDNGESHKDIRQYMHECEVRDCIKRFYPDGQAMAAHLDLVDKRRGKEAGNRLREDVRRAWKEQARKKS